MQLGCLMAMRALHPMWMGGQGLYASVKDRSPLEFLCGQSLGFLGGGIVLLLGVGAAGAGGEE